MFNGISLRGTDFGRDKLIKDFKPGDLVLSRSEFDPSGPVEPKVVEEVFVRVGQIVHLHVGGQVIRTTSEHPFWVHNKGWLPSRELKVGDLFSSHDGQAVAVEDLLDTGETTTVYNVRVADNHTYFVGSREWGFSVWAHNACIGGAAVQAGEAGAFARLRGLVGDRLTPHHMPQAALGFTPYGEGGALVLPHVEHLLTRTYGFRGALTAAQEAGLPFRTVLLRDILDIRNLFGSKYNQGLLDLIQYYRTNFPQLM